MQIPTLDVLLQGVRPINIYGTPEIVIPVVSWIHTSKGRGGGGGRLATLAALCLSTSRARLRASARLGGKDKTNHKREERQKIIQATVTEQCKIKGKPKMRFLSTCTDWSGHRDGEAY